MTGPRTQACGRAEAEIRLAQARKFLDVAELVASEDGVPESASVSAALAVLGGTAASDAACCAALSRRPRGQDHHEAEALIAAIEPGGKDAAKSLRRLISLKDTAHYGLIHVSGQNLKAALRQAASLVEFAAATVTR